MVNIQKKYRPTVKEESDVQAPDRAHAPVTAYTSSCVSGIDTAQTPGLAADRVYQLAAVTAGIILLATLL